MGGGGGAGESGSVPRGGPTAGRIDEEAERRELEAAGWERVEHRGQGETAWRSPENGLVYPQGAAVALVREGANLDDVPMGPEGEA